MSIENVKKVKEIQLNFEKALSEENDEAGNELFDKAAEDLECIVKTKDEDILPTLFDLFIIPDLDYTGVCESLFNDIFQYYSIEQIIKVFYEKFDKLIRMNIARAVQFFDFCIQMSNFSSMRKMFNTVKSDKSKEFLNELEEWRGKKYLQEIKILREDVENWN